MSLVLDGQARSRRRRACGAAAFQVLLAMGAWACERRLEDVSPSSSAAGTSASAPSGLARAEPRKEPGHSLAKPAVDPSRAGAAAAHAEQLGQETLYVCVNSTDGHIVQRVALPGGEAFMVAHARNRFRVSEGRLAASARDELGRALHERGFFELPEHLPEPAGGSPAPVREWDLRAATSRRRHEVHALEGGVLTRDFAELFAHCERAFAPLDSRPADLRGALAVYRTLEDHAKGLPAGDQRRALLLEWLDSLQGDYLGRE